MSTKSTNVNVSPPKGPGSHRSEGALMPEAMQAGVKLKMPVGLLGHVTRTQNALEEMRKTGGVEAVVRETFSKYKDEVERLKEACALVKPANDVQQAAKQAWIAKNLTTKELYLNALQQVFGNPELQLNDKAVVNVEDGESMRSARSRAPSVMSTSSSGARREAAARTKVLEMEMEHRARQRRLEEQERQLRHQREDEELALKLQQARVTEEALESDKGSQRAGSRVERDEDPLEDFPDTPQMPDLPPISTWAPRTSVLPPAPAITSWAQTALPAAADATQGLLQQVLLPQSTLPTFKGDYLDFMWFLKTFEMRVERVTQDPMKRLHLLLQHLEGDPKTLVKGCQLMDDAYAGYARAKEKLVHKYGNKVRQALSFKAELLAWPAVKKDAVKELEKFSIQLQLCQDVQLTGGLAELDAAGTLVHLMRKLPHKMQEAWQMKAYKIESNQRREANFSDFTRFVSDAAAARTHPVYGSQHEPKREQRKGATALVTVSESLEEKDECQTVAATVESGRKAESTPLDATKPPCLICTGGHATESCRTAAKLTVKERRRKLGGLCFGCLQEGHPARECPKRAECLKCKGSHPTILHIEKTNKTEKSKEQETIPKAAAKEDVGQSEKQSAKACATVEESRVAVAVVPVKVWCTKEKEHRTVNAVLDPGSTATFITNRLVEQLGLGTTTSSLQLTTMTSNKQTVETKVVAGVHVASLDQDANDGLMLPPMYTVETMPYNRADVAREEDVLPWKHLVNVPFNWVTAEVGLLIGMNAPAALKPLEVVSGSAEEPYAVKTKLGWSLNGPLVAKSRGQRATANLIKVEEINQWLKKLYSTDFEEAYNFEKKGLSQDDRTWLESAEKSITKLPTKQYQIALPFRQEPPPLKNNFDQAMQRLNSLKKRFAVNARFKADYVAFMDTMIKEGYVEEVDTERRAAECGGNDNDELRPVSYVPHHGVYHPHKPDKIRVVFNCSNKYHGVSLNDCLIPGPDLTNSIVGVLIRFRQEPVAFMADIESMFYRVQVPQKDRDVLRYLWWPGGDVDAPQGIKTYRMKVHLFGATSSPSCANFALRKAAEEARDKGEDEDVCKAVRRNFYVDDCLKSMPDVDSAVRMAKGLIATCASGGFRLTKFVSTSTALLRAMRPEDLAKGVAQVSLDEDKGNPLGDLQERALGVSWEVAADVFRLAVTTQIKGEKEPTKRSLLSTLSALYDPLGIVSPVSIIARILFRELTRDHDLKWDDRLDAGTAKKWTTWLQDLVYLKDVKLRRCFRPNNKVNSAAWQLHVFCDASEDAYSAVAYLRQGQEGHDEAHVTFVLGKARVSPPKVVTIPRLELTGAKLAVDIACIVERELQYTISRRVFWTDSQTVIKYLNNKQRRFHTFVANRVGSILAASKASEWRYVPTDQNPADEGSRGVEAHLFEAGLWLRGPTFLKNKEETWPNPQQNNGIEANDPEVRSTATQANHVPQSGQDCFVESLAGRYSSFARLRAAVRVWRGFIAHVRHSTTLPISNRQQELRDAEASIVKGVQRSYWQPDYVTLSEGGTLQKNSKLYKLNPLLTDERVMVMGSRTRAHLPLIPGQSRVATIIVQDAHVSQAHFGRQATAAKVLSKYWVVGLNKLVRKVIRDCPACQRRHSQPKIPQMGELPTYRIEPGKAFQTTGVDYFGPFVIKRARTTTKMYGVLFTCATVRAIHLELAEDLSGSCFINALRRFVARRGQVRRLVSDNGTNFVGAEASLRQEVQKEMKQLQRNKGPIASWLSEHNIEWTFNPPGASHHGGFWERLIRSVRKALSALLPEQRPLTYDGMATVLCEIEAILNNRPLTTVSEDLDDHEALTPNHLLLGVAGPAAPPGDYSRVAIPLKKQWRQVQHVAMCFWRRWTKEYRSLLHQRSKWLENNGRPLAVHDVVLVMDNIKPRDYWPLGIVIALHPGKDGKVRVVSVKTVKGEMRRSVNKLCVLETASASHVRHA